MCTPSGQPNRGFSPQFTETNRHSTVISPAAPLTLVSTCTITLVVHGPITSDSVSADNRLRSKRMVDVIRRCRSGESLNHGGVVNQYRKSAAKPADVDACPRLRLCARIGCTRCALDLLYCRDFDSRSFRQRPIEFSAQRRRRLILRLRSPQNQLPPAISFCQASRRPRGPVRSLVQPSSD